jgi:HNH endonuclease
VARGTQCAVHTHEAAEPLERHHMQPLSRGGPNTPDNLVLICANAHGNVHYLLTAIEGARGYAGIPLAVKRSYGPEVKRIALTGWERYAEAFLAGRLWREVELWSTDGLPRRADVPPYGWAAHTAELIATAALGTSDPYAAWARERWLSAAPLAPQ